MLVLSRKIEEGLRIGDTIEIRVLDVFTTDNGASQSKVASIGIEAPREICILRGELKQTVQTNIEAGQSARDLSGLGLSGMFKKKKISQDSEE